MNERTNNGKFALSLTHSAPQTHRVPETYHRVEGDEDTKNRVLLTVAALFFHPLGKVLDGRGRVQRLFGNEQTQSTGYLALYAAGARIRLSVEDWTQMERLVAEYSDQLFFGDFGDMLHAHRLAKFARREAYRRAERENLTGRVSPPVEETAESNAGLAEVDFNAGRGYGELGNGLPADFDATASQYERLVTYAALFAHRKMGPTNRRAQAIVCLALYAAGADVALTHDQFRILERVVRQYLRDMRLPKHGVPVNGDRAHYVLSMARRRARKEGVFSRRSA